MIHGSVSRAPVCQFPDGYSFPCSGDLYNLVMAERNLFIDIRNVRPQNP
jgi:hypothetical protein